MVKDPSPGIQELSPGPSTVNRSTKKNLIFRVFHGFFKELDFKELDFKELDLKELDFKELDIH